MKNVSASKNQTVNSYLWDQDQTLQANIPKFLKRVKVWDGNSQKLLSVFNIILSDSYVVCQHLLQVWDEFYSTKANVFMMTSVKTTKYLYPNVIISQNDCVSFLIARKTLGSSTFLVLCCRSDLRQKQLCTVDKVDFNIKMMNNSLYMHKTETVIEIPCRQDTKIRMIFLFFFFFLLWDKCYVVETDGQSYSWEFSKSRQKIQ